MKIAILSNGPANYTTKRLKEEATKTRSWCSSYKVQRRVYGNWKNNSTRIQGDSLERFDAIVPRIAQSYTKYGTAIARQLEGTIQPLHLLSIVRVINYGLIRFLPRLGAIPKTVFARESASFDDIIEQLVAPPLIIKVARGTHGNGVVLAKHQKQPRL